MDGSRASRKLLEWSSGALRRLRLPGGPRCTGGHETRQTATMDRRLVVLIFSAAALVLAALPASAQQKTVKQCNAEWTANKASIQASGKTKKAFVAECRGQSAGNSTTTAAPPRAPSSAAPPTAGATPSPPTRPAATAPRTREATREPSAAGQFSTETQAKARCPSETVVWLNT